MMNLFLPRNLSLIGFAACSALILAAYYFQYAMDLEPCPLCMAQRIAIYAVGLVFLVSAIHNPMILGQRIYSAFALLFSLGGVALASRQLWLQSLPPDQVPACGPGLDYMIDVLPWTEVVSVMLRGTGDCAEVKWTFLTLSIPGWTFIAFIALTLISLMLFKRRPI